MFVSIDSHSEKPCFFVEFVDTYSIHSFPPPSRRTQQIQGFQRSGAGVSPVHMCRFVTLHKLDTYQLKQFLRDEQNCLIHELAHTYDNPCTPEDKLHTPSQLYYTKTKYTALCLIDVLSIVYSDL